MGERDERITGHLGGEARAAVAQDAPLPVEVDEELMGIGFSKCRFSSMKRLSPGPWLNAWSWRGHSPPLSHTGQSSGWLARRNSSTPSCAFLTVGVSVWTT
jgi:hypothetical protein